MEFIHIPPIEGNWFSDYEMPILGGFTRLDRDLFVKKIGTICDLKPISFRTERGSIEKDFYHLYIKNEYYYHVYYFCVYLKNKYNIHPIEIITKTPIEILQKLYKIYIQPY